MAAIAEKWKEYYAFMEQQAREWGSVQEQKESPEQTVAVEMIPVKEKIVIDEDVEVVDFDEEEEEPEEDEEAEPEPPPISNIERKDVKILLLVREILRRQANQAERRRRAEDIRQVDKSLYEIKPDSIEDYIMRVLSVTDEPLHINWIIAHIEALGWKSTSTFHKYTQVHKALRANDYMFVKMGKGLFKLRGGFRKIKPEKTERVQREKIPDLTRLRHVVVEITKKYQTKNGIYPGRVHHIMRRTGFPCAYSSVYRAMQSKQFAKQGSWYKLADDVQNSTPQSSDRQ